MQALLGGSDIKELYGLLISGGIPSLLALPERKDSLNHDWPEEPGLDIDLSNPQFKARQFTFNCAIIADDRDDFFSKYNGLFTALSVEGVIPLYINDHDRTYNVYYISQQNCTKLSKIINTTKVGIKFDLVFGETNPADNIPAVYLVDDQDRFLTA